MPKGVTIKAAKPKRKKRAKRAKKGTGFYGRLLKSWGFEKTGLGWLRKIHMESGNFQVLVEEKKLENLPPRNVQALLGGIIVMTWQSSINVAERDTNYWKQIAAERQAKISGAAKVLNG